MSIGLGTDGGGTADMVDRGAAGRTLQRAVGLDRAARYASLSERTVLLVITGLVVTLPLVHMVLRATLGSGIVGAGSLSQSLALWIGWIGAISAAFRGEHLGLGNVVARVWPGAQAVRTSAVTFVSAAVSGSLMLAAADFVLIESETDILIGDWLPVWVVALALPIGLLGIVSSFFLAPGSPRVAATLGLLAAVPVAQMVSNGGMAAGLPVLIMLVLGFAVGVPIYVVIGGSALLLLTAVEVPAAAVAVEAYRIASSPIIPAIPLFTLVGFLMSAGRANERLVDVFGAMFGWIPGGIAFACVLVCAFFSSFTGSSGVLILALGGLLVPILTKTGHSRRFATGLVTSAGSAGLLLPPSLAMILVAVMAHISILDLFVASLLPAAVMILAIGGFAIWRGVRGGVRREAFDRARLIRALWAARWELATPFVALGSIFGGFATLLEAAALTVGYTLFVSVVIHREIDVKRDLGAIVLRSSRLIGAIMIVLSMSMALTSYMIDAQIPAQIATWAEETIGSPLLFLLALNIVLLIAGCVMDVFSAIAVLTPILLPVAAKFGVSPAHLAIVLLANLELGYLTPPVGMNLFLAANRFDQSVGQVVRSVLPFLAIMLIAVLAITYLPLLLPFPGI